ncbi:unnamed protein product [Moneuplotes crassus]|uniref:Tetrahydrofolate synthase n=1 Tax=Euplotes crassus TaxID=5936 RepID=A0AAD1UFH0_EUPCR|nr:unnamed protein product [Moneuplotes crassus]
MWLALNGKGSVSFKTAALLEKSGFKTGLFTSPHVSCVRERIRVNRQLMSKEEFVKYFDICKDFEQKAELTFGFFQMMLSMALLYFQQQRCDYIVLECGIGGLASSTNVVDSDFAAITSVGFDHRESLGPTEMHICRNKAGIIRQDIPLIVGPTIPLNVVEPICKVHNSKLVVVDSDTQNFVEMNKSIAYALYKEIIETEKEIPHDLNEEEIEEALDVTQECRMDLIPSEKIKEFAPGLDCYPKAAYMDVAHNSPALKSLISTVNSIHKDSKPLQIYVICTFSEGKEIAQSLETLRCETKVVKVVIIKHFKLIKEDNARKYISEVNSSQSPNSGKITELYSHGDLEKNTRSVLEQISQSKNQNAILLHCGSVFLMEYIKDLYNIPQEKDMDNLNSLM